MPNARKRKSPPTTQYVCLALLFLIVFSYQVRATIAAFPGFFSHNAPSRPFVAEYRHGRPIATFVRPEAQQAGLREDDELAAINGRPFTGTAVFGEAFAKAKPGDTLQVTARTPGDSAERTVTISLVRATFTLSWATASVIVLKVVLPFFSILLGFWVVLARPRDRSAWLLLGVLLGVANLFSADVETWGRGIRDVAELQRMTCNTLWPLFMLYFGLYFSEPFPADRPRWYLRVATRILVPAVVLSAVVDIILRLGEIENFAAVAPLYALWRHISVIGEIAAIAATSCFFAFVGMKFGMAVSPDTKRRLRLLYAGTTVAMTPTFVLILVNAVTGGGELEKKFPEWLVLSALALIILFPITLAYVIVVQRALDVRVVLRQGLQYALARGTVRVVRGLLSIGLIWASVSLLEQSRSNSLRFYFIIAAAIVVGLGLRHFGDWLRAWTDRRFFRDAYHAEQILASLSDEVRAIVEKQPLLERVATKIAEALYISRVAVLVHDGAFYRPAYAMGYGEAPAVEFPETAETVRRLRREPEPEHVYFDDEDSWVNSVAMTDDERARLEALGSQLLLPLSVKQNLLGVISLGEKKSEEAYSGTDVRLLKSVAAQTGLALANAELTTAMAEEVARREKLNREVEIAREVQERLFPQKLPPIPGLDYFGRCRTALGVGGDYYDFLALPEGKLGVALGDVSGKGIAAALMMASLEASIRSEAMRAGNDLAGMIARVNQMIFDASAEDRYATLFYAQYDPTTRRLLYVNAGHCAPMLFRRVSEQSGQGATPVERLDQAGGPVVGLMPKCPYEQAEVLMSPGDVLVIYSDGISEAMNPSLEEWGERRLIDSVGSPNGQPAQELIARIMQSADTFASGAAQHDDMTLVVLHAVPG
jgi:phosphoserine phosphatase RsbU/P